MPRLERTIDSRVDEIDKSIVEWRQGDLISQFPIAFFAIAPEFPAPDTRKRLVQLIQDDAEKTLVVDDFEIFTSDENLPVVVVSQTCDLNERVGNEPWFAVAPVRRLLDPADAKDEREREARKRAWRNASSGSTISRFAIARGENDTIRHPVLGDGLWFVDLRLFLTAEKGVLLKLKQLGIARQEGVPGALLPRFALRIQERWGREALDDIVHAGLIRPLVEALRRVRDSGSDRQQEILASVDEIRYTVELVDTQNYRIEIYICFGEASAEGVSPPRAESERVLQSIVGTGASRMLDVADIRTRFVSSDLNEMTAAEYRSSSRLIWADG